MCGWSRRTVRAAARMAAGERAGVRGVGHQPDLDIRGGTRVLPGLPSDAQRLAEHGSEAVLDSGNTSVVTPGMIVNGTVRGKGPLLVQGRIDGRVIIDGEVHVAAKANIGADVEADIVEVKGIVKGPIKGRTSVSLEAGAQVEGQIEAPRIEIDPAARVKGRLVMPLQLPRGIKAPTQTRDPWAT